ncbi:MAG: galactokinase [Planctomycetes bacterium]|nr:galactokinase [Planctomycetota bacterium]
MRPEQLLPAFAAAFPDRRPTLAVRAPGRVNLIGEHTDYNGLPVFPMAIQREVRVVLAPRDDARVRLVNVAARFAPRAFELAPAIEPYARGDWGNYAKAAAQMLVERAGIRRGADLVVEGDVPVAAGLSSSSAFLVACTLALLAANGIALERAHALLAANEVERADGLLAPQGITIGRTELAELCARAERFVGTQSGGMDQAICLGGRAGHALVIDFAPMRSEAVRMPDDWRFVIADTGVKAEKSGAARDAYNARTKECRAALERVRASWSGAPSSWFELVERHATEELLERASRAFASSGAVRSSPGGEGTGAPGDVLLRRFRHVVTEGARVRGARAAMLAGDARGFGARMDASHASLRDDYDVSCAELDELVHLAHSAGALGARLTGAGFGGCIVALVRADDAARVVSELRARYHAPRGLDAEASVLVACASDGASTTSIA